MGAINGGLDYLKSCNKHIHTETLSILGCIFSSPVGSLCHTPDVVCHPSSVLSPATKVLRI